MKVRWNRVSATVFDSGRDPGDVSMFFDYDLRCWLFGFSLDCDPCWYDFRLSCGPLGLSIMVWRVGNVALLDD